MENESLFIAMKDRTSDHVARQQIAGELNPPKLEPRGTGKGVGQRRLAHSGHVFNQQMSTRQQASRRESDDVVLSDDDGRNSLQERLDA